MPHLGPTELIIILAIVLLIFGAGRLGSVGGALGKAVKDFRSAMKPEDDEAEGAAKAPAKVETQPPSAPQVASAAAVEEAKPEDKGEQA